MANRPRILLAVPAYNESDSICTVLKSLVEFKAASKFAEYEVVVFDDGSIDNTRIVASSYCRVMSRQPNGGLGQNIDRITKYVILHNFDYVILMEADGQYSIPEEYLIIRMIISCPDSVILSRYNYYEIQPSIFRKILHFIISYISYRFVGMRDGTTGFRILSNRFCRNLTIRNRYNPCYDLNVLAAELGFHEYFIKAHHIKRRSRLFNLNAKFIFDQLSSLIWMTRKFQRNRKNTISGEFNTLKSRTDDYIAN